MKQLITFLLMFSICYAHEPERPKKLYADETFILYHKYCALTLLDNSLKDLQKIKNKALLEAYLKNDIEYPEEHKNKKYLLDFHDFINRLKECYYFVYNNKFKTAKNILDKLYADHPEKDEVDFIDIICQHLEEIIKVEDIIKVLSP